MARLPGWPRPLLPNPCVQNGVTGRTTVDLKGAVPLRRKLIEGLLVFGRSEPMSSLPSRAGSLIPNRGVFGLGSDRGGATGAGGKNSRS